MECRLAISGQLPNLNDYIAKCNINKFRGSQLKRETEQYISKFIKSQLRDIKLTEPVIVQFHWFEPDKKRDLDNIAFAKKFIFDALVKCGVLANDGWSCVQGFTDEFYVDALNPRVEVVIKTDLPF